MWTTFTEAAYGGAAAPNVRRRPWWPRWLSVPVAVCAPLVVLGIVVLAVLDPVSVLAGLVPLALVLPVVAWFDRVEPEPRASKVHALLWGATVAIVGGVIINTLVAVTAGEAAAIVLSAPIAEEALKGLGIVWAVRRREVDGVSDGIVYAAWVALGFAVVEDMTYFAQASVEGAFVPVFILRALLTPFAHPLFTFWIGLAIGLAVRRGARLWPSALWGYGLAVASHMAWNGSLAITEIDSDIDEDVAIGVILVMAAVFVLLFAAVAIAMVVMRRREQRRFIEGVPAVVARHGITPVEAAMFASWGSVLAARRQLPRSHRRDFDAVHAAIARLVQLQQRPVAADPDSEVVLGEQLAAARARLHQRR
jgi:RsiW-degrading membrane proteinase PrsW (M82 family)